MSARHPRWTNNRWLSEPGSGQTVNSREDAQAYAENIVRSRRSSRTLRQIIHRVCASPGVLTKDLHPYIGGLSLSRIIQAVELLGNHGVLVIAGSGVTAKLSPPPNADYLACIALARAAQLDVDTDI